MAEYIENSLSGKLRGVTYEDGKIIDVHIRDTDDVVKVFIPVRHGRWEEADWFEPDCHSFGTIRTLKAALRCSNCKHCFKKELLWKDNYCPNCGAKMDGGDENG